MTFPRSPFNFLSAAILFSIAIANSHADERSESRVRYGIEKVGGVDIFYREAGNLEINKPALVLLHGFPSSPYKYREVLADIK